MSENVNQKGVPQKIETTSEAYGSSSSSGFLAEEAKNPKEQGEGAYQQNGQTWLGGPQNGNETPSQSDSGPGETWTGRGKAAAANVQDPPEYNLERAKTPKESSGWLGGPQNGDKTPNKKTEGAYQTASHSTGWEDRKRK
jgi:hypothetical protein